MAESLRFETPENVQVQYEPAGLGTRFLAWFVDQLLLTLILFLALIGLAVAGISLGFVVDKIDFEDIPPEEVFGYVIGVATLITGLGSFIYFSAAELLMRGQTPGKKMCQIRVVKVDGFSLDPASVITRNFFRVIDNFALVWIVPVLSKKSQRIGDMVAGTTVVFDDTAEMSDMRAELLMRPASEAEFRFDAVTRSKIGESDFEAIERLLERWKRIPDQQRDTLLATLVTGLVAKLNVEAPEEHARLRFLEDLFASELRGQQRALR